MARNDQPRSWQYWNSISATPADFELDAGVYGLALTATWGGGNATLQMLLPDGSTYVAVATAVTANGYAVLQLPAGQYRLAITTATALIGVIALIARGGFR